MVVAAAKEKWRDEYIKSPEVYEAFEMGADVTGAPGFNQTLGD